MARKRKGGKKGKKASIHEHLKGMRKGRKASRRGRKGRRK